MDYRVGMDYRVCAHQEKGGTGDTRAVEGVEQAKRRVV